MSDVARKVFPLESVLALLVGKEDAAVTEMAGFLTGRSLCCCSTALVAPMAAGWLANLYPAFINLKYDGSQPWANFVSGMRSQVGDNVSVPPMTGPSQAMVAKVLDAMAEKAETLKVQAAEITTLQARVEALEPFQGKAEEQEKKIGQLEAKVKSQNADIGALRREMIPFQGKMPVDQQELENIIKDAIVKNLKNFTGGMAAAGVVAAGEAVAEAAAEESGGVPDSFGFGASGSDGDGFGF
ncbi:MAG: hypothetical protein LBI88_00695 [Deltaproteobacteria bacterium]|jgi:hypothetical protein|nr:hypothetical protein [Deltaproteobacteria bacterium]